MRTYLLYQLIVTQAYWIISLPFYAYGIIKWKLHIRHLMIHKRFPFISLLIIISSFLNGSLLLFLFWRRFITVHDRADYVINIALSFFVYGLINLRLFLNVMRWTTHQNIIHLDVPPKQVKKTRSLYHHWLSIVILLISIVGAFCVFFIHPFAYYVFTVMMVINLSLIVVICYKKVKDGIGCLKENLIMLLALVMVMVLNILFTIDTIKYFVFPIIQFSPWFQGLFPLFSPLYYIRQLEQQMDLAHHVTTINDTSTSSVNTPDEFKKDDDIEIVVSKDQNLCDFLMKHANYVAFRSFMAHCWASENLLFLVQSQTLKQTVLKYAHTKSEHVEKYPLHFAYLKASYTAIQERIDKCSGADKETAIEFNEVRDVFYELHQEIYDEFVDDGAQNAINISHDTKQYLSALFGDKVNKDKFKCFDDFVDIFDTASHEIARLVVSMYECKFQKYIKDHT
eukprot:187581_1